MRGVGIYIRDGVMMVKGWGKVRRNIIGCGKIRVGDCFVDHWRGLFVVSYVNLAAF